MRKIVIDTSAVLATLLHEAQADAILAATAGKELISPASLPYEITNALSARMRRQASDPAYLSPEQTDEAWDLFTRAEIALYPVDNDHHAMALSIAAHQGTYCYDAYLIALALAEGAPLLTLDGSGKRKGLQQAALGMGVKLVHLEG